MKPLIHISRLRTFLNELPNHVEIPSVASFKTTGIVKDKTRVTPKYHLILDVMLSTLRCEVLID
jgi:hypothetical protein